MDANPLLFKLLEAMKSTASQLVLSGHLDEASSVIGLAKAFSATHKIDTATEHGLMPNEVAALKSGGKISAIKEIRAHRKHSSGACWGLLEAKELVEAFMAATGYKVPPPNY